MPSATSNIIPKAQLPMTSSAMDTPPDTSPEASVILRKNTTKKELAFRGPQTFVTIHIGAGDERESFMVQKSLAYHHSPVFDAAFNGGFIEGQTQEMSLDDVDAGVFALLVGWMYQGRIWQGTDGTVAAVDLAKLWDLGDRLLMPRLQNIVMDKLGCPDRGPTCQLFTKSLEYMPLIAMEEFIDYIGLSADEEKPLGRYCVRVLLNIFALEKCCYTGIDGQGIAQMWMQIFLGGGVACGAIRSLMGIFRDQEAILPAWDIKDYYVKENV